MRALIATTVLLLLGSASANAATVSLEYTPGWRAGTARIVFVAAPGEVNAVLATIAADLSWVIRDDGAPLTAGTGCTALDAHSSRCTPPVYSRDIVAISTLDGNDIVSTPAAALVRIDGGDGDDVIAGGGTLAGGPGRDRLTGGAGTDLLSGGSGDDVLDGGPGTDVAFYANRKAPVVADLAKGTAGSNSERDVLRAIESVEGGAGDDTLAGDAGPNELRGGDGADTLSGRDGHDTLLDGRGVDLLVGGDGNDVLASSDASDRLIGGRGADQLASITGARLDSGGGADTLSFGGAPQVLRCGTGTDTVMSTHLMGLRLDSCERADIPLHGALTVAVKPRRRTAGALAVPVAYRGAGIANSAFGTIALLLHRGGRRLPVGRAEFRVVNNTRTELLIRPSASGRRALRRAPNAIIEVRVSAEAAIDPAHINALPLFGTPRAEGRWRIRL